MGIALYQLLAQEYFKDFHVITGHKGLTKEVQGALLPGTQFSGRCCTVVDRVDDQAAALSGYDSRACDRIV